MCGRFTLRASPERLAEHFDLDEPPELAPRFNIAPGQDVAAVCLDPQSGRRALELRRWGLVPPWAEDPRVGSRMINARAETLAEKPAFRDAFRHRRCLVPADGFYEWAGARGDRQPYHIARPDADVFGFAALWERWRGRGGEALVSCALVTTRANAAIRALHDRMPVILDPADYARWLDPDAAGDELLGLLGPCPEGRLEVRPVSLRVNDVGRDDPSCVAPVASQASLF